jgi:sulfonate transport system permease protein
MNGSTERVAAVGGSAELNVTRAHVHAALRWRALGRTLTPWAAPFALLIAWEIGVRTGVLSRVLVPSPLEVAHAAVVAVRDGGLLWHIAVSALRAALGLAVGASIGLVLGLATGLSRPAQLVLDTPLQMLRAVPALALVPLVIVWFGLGESAKLFIVAVTVLFPVYLNTFHGVRSVDPQLLEMARVYGVRGFALYREIVLPGALPSMLVGLRFGLGISWLVLIVAESIGAKEGLGYVAMNAREFMQMDVLVLTIVLWALMGKLTDVAARALETRLLPWQPKSQRMAAD